MSRTKKTTGTVAANTWPDTLPAHVVSVEGPPHVHGYDLYGDLATHYDFGEYVITALTGSPPTAELGRAVNMALIALGATTVADASVHAATLARRCGANPKSTLATGLLTLAEEAEGFLEPGASPPLQDSNAAEAGLSFFRDLPRAIRDELGTAGPTVQSTAQAVLRLAGLDTPLQQLTAIVLARLPALAAETQAVMRGSVRDYPMQLPRFEYEPEGDA